MTEPMTRQTEEWLKPVWEALERGDAEGALRRLAEAKRVARDDPDKLLAVATAYADLGHPDEARGLLDTVLAERPGDSEARLLLAEVYLELGETDAALDVLMSLLDERPDDVRVLVNLADLYATEGLYEVAVSYLEKARRHHPEPLLFARHLAQLYDELGDEENALALLESLVGTPYEDADLYVELGARWARRGAWEDAARHYEEALARDPANERARLGLALLKARMGHRDEAKTLLEAVRRDNPDCVPAYIALADLHLAEGDVASAIERLEQAWEMDKGDEVVAQKLAWACLEAGRVDRAAAVFEEMVGGEETLDEPWQALREAIARARADADADG
ncbi:MAG: tetratricopeptide repeat protein [Calditerricola sp.]|nr:tetratricopeptide repeat protein [Calditerricola sp.]